VKVRFTLLLLSIFFLEACVNLKYLEKEIEQNPHVKNVFIMENMSEPFGPTKIRIGINLVNEGRLVLDYMGKRETYILLREIGGYCLMQRGLRLDNNGNWIWGFSNCISSMWMEMRLNASLNSLNDIVERYNDIYYLIDKIYNEGPIPKDEWDNKKLNIYTGYFETNTLRTKIYVGNHE
jgi:hypothetical protein